MFGPLTGEMPHGALLKGDIHLASFEIAQRNNTRD